MVSEFLQRKSPVCKLFVILFDFVDFSVEADEPEIFFATFE